MINATLKLIETWDHKRLNAPDAAHDVMRVCPAVRTPAEAMKLLAIVRRRRVMATMSSSSIDGRRM